MPTYEYTCKGCGHHFDASQPMTAKLLKKCPQCGAGKLYRHIGTGGGIIFKGSGFYATDYRKGGPSKDSASKAADPKTPCAPTGCEKPGCPKPDNSDD